MLIEIPKVLVAEQLNVVQPSSENHNPKVKLYWIIMITILSYFEINFYLFLAD